MIEEINKQPHNWEDEQIVAWAAGKVKVGPNVTEEDLAKEAAKRMEKDFTDVKTVKEDVLKSIDTSKEEDEVVEVKEEPVSGETEPTKEPAKKERKAEAPKKEENPKPQAPKPQKGKTTQAIKTGSVDASQQLLDDVMDEYLEKMAPGRSHMGNEGSALQMRLYRMIKAITKQNGKDFNKLYGQLLDIVNEYRNRHFHEMYIYRYFDTMKLPIADRKNFERIINLMITTCDPSTRKKKLEQVDLDKTMEGFGEEANQKMVAFYQGK